MQNVPDDLGRPLEDLRIPLKVTVEDLVLGALFFMPQISFLKVLMGVERQSIQCSAKEFADA